MIKTLGRVLLGGIIKNEQVQFFDSQMYLQLYYVMLCYGMWNLFTVGSLQFHNDSAIASLETNQNRPIILKVH